MILIYRKLIKEEDELRTKLNPKYFLEYES